MVDIKCLRSQTVDSHPQSDTETDEMGREEKGHASIGQRIERKKRRERGYWHVTVIVMEDKMQSDKP